MILLSLGSWWSTFPWQSVGGVGVVVGFIIGALKVAAMIGAQKQVGVDHDRRILALEGKADGAKMFMDGKYKAQGDISLMVVFGNK